jgi:hypothetical protein
LGELADEAVDRALDQMDRFFNSNPEERRRMRQQKKQQRIREAGLHEDRQIRAIIAKKEYCLDQLPDLDDDED